MNVVYGTTANVAGAAIRNFRIGPSLSNRIKSGRPIRIRIESGSFAGPYQKATYAACEHVFLAVTEIGDVKDRNGPKFELFSNFWPILWNPLAKVDGSMPECAQLCALHMRPQLTLLRKTETVDGSVALGVIRKTGIMSLTFWLTL